jgi:chaperonin GroES
MNIKPLGPTVLIEPAKAAEQTAGGLFIPDQAREKPQEGIVKVLGTGGRDEKGKLIPFEVKVGDRVLLSKYGASDLKLDGVTYKLANVEDIIAIIE